MLQTPPPETLSREGKKASPKEGADSEEAREEAAGHLWQFASEKSTLHALIIRSLSEARQRNEGDMDERELSSKVEQQPGVPADKGIHPSLQ